MSLPEIIENVTELDHFLTQPSELVIESLRKISGDLMILGAGGKMGISLSILAKRAIKKARIKKKIYAVSLFDDKIGPKKLESNHVKVISCDLLNEKVLQSLPDVENIIYMVGMKFGTFKQEAKTWVINSYLPGLICSRFKNSRMVLFSTGNVYPLVSVNSKGCTESDPLEPLGEYAQSALGRERVFEYFCEKNKINGLIFRLNYAIDLRYGVLLDIAQKVFYHRPIQLDMGYANIIWQGDANAIALRSLEYVKTPPLILNVTGKSVFSVREISQQFADLFNVSPIFNGKESDNALLSDSNLCYKMFGKPLVKLDDMIRWTAYWVKNGGPTLEKPTHYEVRNGKY